jgi:hypothetical protein
MMKAFLIVLLVLVLAGAVVFYFGWIQIQLPPEHYGVVFATTSGYDPVVVRPGEFVWRWEKLVPTNLTLYLFDLHPYQGEFTFDQKLPSADLYASVLPGNPDFAIHGRLQVTFTIQPEELPALVEANRLTPDSLQAYYESAAGQLIEVVRGRLQRLEAAELRGSLTERFRELVAAELPSLEVTSLSLSELVVPDPQLYDLAKRSYEELVATQSQARNAAAARLAVEEAQEDRRVAADETRRQTLKKYGELFNEYPVLLKAMAIQQLRGSEQLKIPELDLSDVLDFSSVGR